MALSCHTHFSLDCRRRCHGGRRWQHAVPQPGLHQSGGPHRGSLQGAQVQRVPPRATAAGNAAWQHGVCMSTARGGVRHQPASICATCARHIPPCFPWRSAAEHVHYRRRPVSASPLFCLGRPILTTQQSLQGKQGRGECCVATRRQKGSGCGMCYLHRDTTPEPAGPGTSQPKTAVKTRSWPQP